MTEKLSYDPTSRLIRIRVWGDDPISDWIVSKQEVMLLHEMHGANRLLVDVREQEVAPALFDILDFGDDWPTTIWLAVLVEKNTPDDVTFLETVATRRRKSIRIFFSEVEALDWLKAPQGKMPGD
jgi:hypothetical protein